MKNPADDARQVEVIPTPAAGPGAGPRVLVAEDHEIGRKVALRLLEQVGCRATAVADGLKAARALEEADYDVVLMDVQMPVMDGIETTATIRRREADLGPGRMPIVVSTADVTPETCSLCLEAGMDGYLVKPFTENLLYASFPSWKPPAPPLQILDCDGLLERRGRDVGFARELLGLFAKTAPASLSSLVATLAAGARAAHGLKGASMSVGADILADSCAVLEATASAGDVAGSREALAPIIGAWAGGEP